MIEKCFSRKCFYSTVTLWEWVDRRDKGAGSRGDQDEKLGNTSRYTSFSANNWHEVVMKML